MNGAFEVTLLSYHITLSHCHFVTFYLMILRFIMSIPVQKAAMVTRIR